MFSRLEKDNYGKIPLSGFPIIDSVISGSQQGEIYVDDSAFFILHKSGFGFFGGKKNPQEFFSFVKNNPQIPQYFHLYKAPQEFVDFLGNNPDFSYKLRARQQLRISAKAPEISETLPQNFKIKKIDPSNFSALEIFKLDLENKFWNKDFLENSFGFGVFDEKNLPVSLCYAAAISQNIAEIDIATLENHRKSGLATIATKAFIREALNRNMKPNWDCFEENFASLKIAQKLGFSLLQKYQFLSIYRK